MCIRDSFNIENGYCKPPQYYKQIDKNTDNYDDSWKKCSKEDVAVFKNRSIAALLKKPSILLSHMYNTFRLPGYRNLERPKEMVRKYLQPAIGQWV